MNEFGSEIARAAALGMCRPGWQEAKPFFETVTSSSTAEWRAHTCRTRCELLSEVSHSQYCPVEKGIAHISLGRRPLADEM